MDLPVMPPVRPMLAKPATRLPDRELSFEPKWDGYRCIVFRDGDEVVLGSRNEKPLNRYFPEMLDPLRASLPDRCVVDGELFVAVDGRLDFDALGQRIHPAESRVTMLAEQTPGRARRLRRAGARRRVARRPPVPRPPRASSSRSPTASPRPCTSPRPPTTGPRPWSGSTASRARASTG